MSQNITQNITHGLLHNNNNTGTPFRGTHDNHLSLNTNSDNIKDNFHHDTSNVNIHHIPTLDSFIHTKNTNTAVMETTDMANIKISNNTGNNNNIQAKKVENLVSHGINQYIDHKPIDDTDKINLLTTKSLSNNKNPSSWDPQDDLLLRFLKEIKKFGWKDIAKFFNNRTPNACQFRWRRLKSGNLKSNKTALLDINNIDINSLLLNMGINSNLIDSNGNIIMSSSTVITKSKTDNTSSSSTTNNNSDTVNKYPDTSNNMSSIPNNPNLHHTSVLHLNNNISSSVSNSGKFVDTSSNSSNEKRSMDTKTNVQSPPLESSLSPKRLLSIENVNYLNTITSSKSSVTLPSINNISAVPMRKSLSGVQSKHFVKPRSYSHNVTRPIINGSSANIHMNTGSKNTNFNSTTPINQPYENVFPNDEENIGFIPKIIVRSRRSSFNHLASSNIISNNLLIPTSSITAKSRKNSFITPVIRPSTLNLSHNSSNNNINNINTNNNNTYSNNNSSSNNVSLNLNYANTANSTSTSTRRSSIVTVNNLPSQFNTNIATLQKRRDSIIREDIHNNLKNNNNTSEKNINDSKTQDIYIRNGGDYIDTSANNSTDNNFYIDDTGNLNTYNKCNGNSKVIMANTQGFTKWTQDEDCLLLDLFNLKKLTVSEISILLTNNRSEEEINWRYEYLMKNNNINKIKNTGNVITNSNIETSF